MYFVYILKSLKKKWYYVGSTNNIERRLKEHNKLKVESTKFYVPLELVYVNKFETEREARDCERRIKDQRTLKESIIKNLK
ncbi:MAG: GIY-YIG nuclease family protein [bacterium]|nr:GIY-YIG nuclease family protein [bacterium]MDO8496436.1 GIY-YIG nuclease family protein [bacterium]